jgi:inner membrane protein
LASAFSHAIAVVAIGKGLSFRQSIKFWLLGIFCSVIPDADVISFHYHIPYDSPFGHRGFTHSLFFAVLLAFLIMFIFFREQKTFSSKWFALLGFFFLATASHGILDAFTNGGLGVEFFFPFNTQRYFFPWRPIQVSPLNIGSFFSEWGLRVLLSEIVWIWIPSFTIVVVSVIMRRKKMKREYE